MFENNFRETHGKVCRKITIERTQTPVPSLNAPDTPEPTITINFFIGSVHSEEILSIETAKTLYSQLKVLLNHK